MKRSTRREILMFVVGAPLIVITLVNGLGIYSMIYIKHGDLVLSPLPLVGANLLLLAIFLFVYMDTEMRGGET